MTPQRDIHDLWGRRGPHGLMLANDRPVRARLRIYGRRSLRAALRKVDSWRRPENLILPLALRPIGWWRD